MKNDLILASGSEIRAKLLRAAGVEIDVMPARIDEDAVKVAMVEERASPRDVADTLAELKSIKVSTKCPEVLVLGCDQTLDAGGALFDKPKNRDDVVTHLKKLSGSVHKLHSAAVVSENGRPIWRHTGTVALTMRVLSNDFIEAYATRNWPGLGHSLGGYKLEEEGSRLFVSIRGEYHDVLGIPLLPLLNWLTLRGVLAS